VTIHSTASQRQRTIHNAHAGHLFFKGNDSGGIDISEAISLASQFLHHRQRCGRKRVTRESHVSIWRPPAKSNKFKKPGRLVSFLFPRLNRPPLASFFHFRPDIPFRQNSKFQVSTIPVGISINLSQGDVSQPHYVGWRATERMTTEGPGVVLDCHRGEMSRKEIGSKASNGVTSFIAKRVLVLPARKRIPLAV
jgi:hypothetical protein